MLKREQLKVIRTLNKDQKLVFGIKARRLITTEAGIRNTEAASRIGITNTMLSLIGSGTRLPSEDVMLTLCDALKIKPEGILKFCEEPSITNSLIELTKDQSNADIHVAITLMEKRRGDDN